jgi:hypothetical protein
MQKETGGNISFMAKSIDFTTPYGMNYPNLKIIRENSRKLIDLRLT